MYYGFIPYNVSKNKVTGDGELDYKIIAVPTRKKNQIIKARRYHDLTTDYPNFLIIFELWFLNYNQNDIATIEGWGDEQEALK